MEAPESTAPAPAPAPAAAPAAPARNPLLHPKFDPAPIAARVRDFGNESGEWPIALPAVPIVGKSIALLRFAITVTLVAGGVSSVQWKPGDDKPVGASVSFKILNNLWAAAAVAAKGAAYVAGLRALSVFSWAPGDAMPGYWRLASHDDDTFSLLNLAFIDNYVMWQPGWGVAFPQYIKHMFSKQHRYLHGRATRLIAFDNKMRDLAQENYDLYKEAHPTFRDDTCFVAACSSPATDLDHNKLTRRWNGMACRECNSAVFPDHDAFGRAFVDRADAIAVHVQAYLDASTPGKFEELGDESPGLRLAYPPP
ncbi:hypothetical protein JL720_3110 [Aureococcus anophagefferens]|nr:hypothetical protein JL720_3110 [Aureococcus anophagefferens]